MRLLNLALETLQKCLHLFRKPNYVKWNFYEITHDPNDFIVSSQVCNLGYHEETGFETIEPIEEKKVPGRQLDKPKNGQSTTLSMPSKLT